MNVRLCGVRGLLVVVAVASPAAAQPERAGNAPLSRFAEQKAEVLLRDKLPCLGCHQFGSDGGRLAPDLATVRTRRSAEYIAAIVRDPQRVRPGTSMPRHPMPASQEQLIVRYLATRAGCGDWRRHSRSLRALRRRIAPPRRCTPGSARAVTEQREVETALTRSPSLCHPPRIARRRRCRRARTLRSSTRSLAAAPS